MKYHVSNDNQIRVCRAQKDNCPLGGTHFSSPEEAQFSLTQTTNSKTKPETAPAKIAADAFKSINKNFTPPDMPLWWDVYRKHFDSKNPTPSNPNSYKILDIIKTPTESTVVIWEARTVKPKDGRRKPVRIQTCVFKNLSNGQTVGSILTTRSTTEDTHVRAGSTQLAKHLKGKGYGSALYIYTAGELAKQNETLSFGKTQSHDAKNLWKRLENNYPDSISTQTIFIQGEKFLNKTFDLRPMIEIRT